MEIELVTTANAFVAVVDVPPFPVYRAPQVVLWGERVFVCASNAAPRPIYREASMAVSLTPSPGRGR